MEVREELPTAYQEPTTEELPPLPEELRQLSFRAFLERNDRRLEEHRVEFLAEQAEAHQEQKPWAALTTSSTPASGWT